MSRLIKALAITLGTLIGLVVLTVVFITQWVDPNDHKPELQRLAAEQGIDLQINGALGWQFFPVLGVTLEDVRIASGLYPSKPVATLSHVSVAVEVMPLLQRQLNVAAVEVDGAVIDLQTDLQARNNWDLPPQAAAANGALPEPAIAQAVTPAQADSQPAAEASSGLALAADRISLRNVNLRYQNFRSGDQAALQSLSVVLEGVNLQGKPFPVNVAAEVHQLKELPALALQLQGALGFDGQQLSLQPMTLGISPVAASDTGTITDTDVTPLNVELTGQLNLQSEPAFDVNLKVSPVNARAWLNLLGQTLDMADEQALTAVGASVRIQGQGESLQLTPLAITVDDTRIEGSVALNQPEQLPLVVALGFDQLNLDRYLPASAQASAAEPAGSSAPAGSATYGQAKEQKLPLDTLRALKLQVSLSGDKLQVANAKLANLDVKLRSNLGVAYLDALNFDTYDGRVEASGHLDGRRSEARMALNAAVSQVELLGLLTDTLQEQRIEGAVSTNVKANSQGSTVEQLQRQLAADITLQAQALQINELDIEKDLCGLAETLGGSSTQGQVWKGYTQLQDVDGQLALREETVSISQFTAGVEELAVKARGELSLPDQRFDIPLDVRVIGQRDENLGCQIRDRWRNKDLPLRCQGSLDTIGARTCQPDKARLGKLLEGEAKQELQDKLNEKLREKFGDKDGEAVEGLLRGIFGR